MATTSSIYKLRMQFARGFGRSLAPKQRRSQTARGIGKECSSIRASAAGRFEICIARCATWKNNLSRIELSRSRQGRSATRQYPEVSLDFFPRVDLDGAASAADRQAARVDPARL